MSRPTSLTPSNKRQRWWLWLPLLAISAWLAFQQPAPVEAEIVQPRLSTLPLRSPDRNAISTHEPLLELHDRQKWSTAASTEEQPTADLFAQRSWTPPPKPVPIAKPVPPPPTAPPLPFTFIGKKSEAGEWEVYLSIGDDSFIAREGTTISEIYRIEQIKPPEMSLTYLPLQQKQVMHIGVSQ